jgi:hypothetical protein
VLRLSPPFKEASGALRLSPPFKEAAGALCPACALAGCAESLMLRECGGGAV